MKNFLKLKSNKATCLFFFCCLTATAQNGGANDHGYLFPMRPGGEASLAGTMGEFRSTHLHSGIDIRTYNQIGWPVLATADGYVSRIAISPVGYGNALYVTHRDGNISLYGHLDHFKPAIQDYTTEERYKRKQSSVNLYPAERQIPVRRGDTIAYSGNSGSTAGPHLHFEIRNANNEALNPLKFGFDEVKDHTPPVAEKIALIPMDIRSRVNDRYERTEFYVQRTQEGYAVNAPILAYGRIGLELLSYDLLDNSSSYRCGYNSLEVRVDGKTMFKQNIDRINFGLTRNVYTLMDYPVLVKTGRRFVKLYVDAGNNLMYCQPGIGNGLIRVQGDEDKKVEVIMTDSRNNSSILSFTLRPSIPPAELPMSTPIDAESSVAISGNTLEITTNTCSDGLRKAWFYEKGKRTELNPVYFTTNLDFFLIDLARSFPDSVVTCGGVVYPGLSARLVPASPYHYYGKNIDISFPSNAVFDTVCVSVDHHFDGNGREIFSVLPETAALNRSVSLSVKPDGAYDITKGQVGLYRMSGRTYSLQSNQWINGGIQFTTSDLGTFTILTDSVPPVITPVYVDNISARLRIGDDLAGINSFEATLNGQWLLMDYDAKSGMISSVTHERNGELKGVLVVTVTDNAGNKTVFKKNIE